MDKYTRSSTTGYTTTTSAYFHSSSPTKGSTHPTTTTSTRPRGYPKPLGRGRGFPVLRNGRFLYSRPATFTVAPRHAARSYSARSHGGRVFSVLPRRTCLHDVRTLVDARTQAPLLRVRHFVLATRSNVEIARPDGTPVLLLRRMAGISLRKKLVHGFLKGRVGGKPDLVVTADLKKRSVVFTDRKSNEIAHVVRRKAGRHGEKAFSYKMYISPGYDTALFVMCMVCVHEAWKG